MRNHSLLIPAFVLSTLMSLSAQSLTVEECVRLAREHYPAVAGYGLLEKVMQFDLSNASKAWLPQGNVGAQLTWQNDVAALPDLLTDMIRQHGVNYPGLDKTQYRVGLDVAQQIWDGGRSGATKRRIEAATDVDRTALDVALYDVEGRVEEIYFAMLLLDGRIDRIQRSILLVDSTLQQVRAMYANGVAMHSDCDQIEARLLTIEQQQTQLKETRRNYRRILEIFIGEPIGERCLMLPAEQPLTKGCHPQLSLYESQIKGLESQIDGIKASSMPTIGAFISGYYGYPGYNMFKNMRTHDPSLNFIAGLKVSWNFGSLYTKKNDIGRLSQQRQQIEANRETFLFNNAIEQQQINGQIVALREVMKTDKRVVELRQAVVRAAQSQLRNGVIDATGLLTKITDEELAENDFILHNIELVRAIYQLNHTRNQ